MLFQLFAFTKCCSAYFRTKTGEYRIPINAISSFVANRLCLTEDQDFAYQDLLSVTVNRTVLKKENLYRGISRSLSVVNNRPAENSLFCNHCFVWVSFFYRWLLIRYLATFTVFCSFCFLAVLFDASVSLWSVICQVWL